ncbi:MAG: hypothetical protein ACI8Z5_001758 [Lentimonas sp.]
MAFFYIYHEQSTYLTLQNHPTRKDSTIRSLPKTLLHIAACALLVAPFASSASARIFTHVEGRTIEAELVSMNKNQVTFRRTADRKTFTLPVSDFSPKDRAYILSQREAGRLSATDYRGSHQPDVARVTKHQDHFGASEQIDKLLAKYWKTQDVTPAPIIDDATYLRRAYLKIIGRIPSYAEAVHFLNDSNPHKRSQLVDKLLDSPGYVSHNFNLWADILRAKTTGREGSRYGGVYYIPWLKDQIRRNVPYDDFVHTLLTANGYPWDNPAVAYYLRDFGMPLDNMSMTAQVFLGTQMQCAQCHDHPTDVWSQKDFYELAAYTYGLKTGVNIQSDNPELKEVMRRLREATKKQNKGKVPGYQKASPLSAGREFFDPLRWGVIHNERPLKLPHDYQYDDAEPQDVVEPKVLFGNQSDAKLHDSTDRVENYVDWLVSKNNARFTLVIANRMWKHVMGKGLIEPIDELTDESVADSPELMEYLESMMIALDYDLKQYLRVLYNTEYFQRQAVIDNLDLPDDYHLEGPIFQRMTSEQIWDSFATLMTPEIDQMLTPSYKGNNGGIQYVTGKRPAAAVYLDEWSPQKLASHIIKMGDVYKAYSEARSANSTANRDPSLKGTPELAEIRKTFNDSRKEWNQMLNPDLGKSGSPPAMDMTMMATNFPGMKKAPTGRRNKADKKWIKSIRRASELQSPQSNGHLLEVFGQSDRMLIENSDDGGNVLQALFLMNSNQTNWLMAQRSAPAMEARNAKTPEAKIETLYIGFLARKPSTNEINALLPYFTEDPEKARQRIIWAMLNTQQFLFIQ